jgi:hypothetical protein
LVLSCEGLNLWDDKYHPIKQEIQPGRCNPSDKIHLTHAKEEDMEQPQNLVTGVLVLLTAKPGVTREQVMKLMPAEIRATVRLYLGGKVQQWYARGDGKGAVFILDCKDVAEAEALITGLPLTGENLMDHEFIPVGPLKPLGLLLGAPPQV